MKDEIIKAIKNKDKASLGGLLSQIAKKLPNDKKEKLISDFTEKHKDHPELEKLLDQFKATIGYSDDKTET